MADLKLGLAQGYWSAGPNPNFVEMAQEAERLGYDSVWSAESWGNDAFTPLCWIGAQTSTIKLGTAVVQLSAVARAHAAAADCTSPCGNSASNCRISSNGRAEFNIGELKRRAYAF